MVTRTSGHTFGVLPAAGTVRWTATLPAPVLDVAIGADLLAYRKACRLTAMTFPNQTTLRLTVAGENLRPTYLRDLFLDVGGVYTPELRIAQPVYRRTADGMTLDFTVVSGAIPQGRALVCSLTRTRPDYFVNAVQDRVRTYRGFQLWDWAYGSRVEDFLDRPANTDGVRRELAETFTGIKRATAPEVSVSQPIPFRIIGTVKIGPAEVDLDL